MPISSDVLEQVRQELGLTTPEFCKKLDVNIDNYSTYIAADDLTNFPPRAMNKLKEIMLDMECENLKKFKDHIPLQSQGHFAGTKIQWHPDKLAVFQANPQKVGPITVEFHPTNRCNHRCPECTFGIPDRDRTFTNVDFNVDLLPELIEDLRELHVRGVDVSGGGEPLLHSDLVRIIHEFRAGGFDVGLVTNGSRLYNAADDASAAKVRETILANCTWCRISVDAGSQAVYEKMHGKIPAVDFDALVENVKILCNEKVQSNSNTTLGVSFLLTPDNFLDLIKSVCLFREIPGLDYFQIKPIVIPPADRVTHPNMIFWDKRLFDALIAVKWYEKKSFKIYTLGFKFIDMLRNEGEGLPFQKCWGHPFYPTICADGTIVVCCHMLNFLLEGRSTGKYGMITANKRLRDIWYSQERFKIGRDIDIRLCPCNCKLSETNKLLEQMYESSPLHINFIG